MRTIKTKIRTLLSLALFGALVGGRVIFESRSLARSKGGHQIVGSRWDPRGFERIEAILKQRETDSFRAKLRSGTSADIFWPGLSSAQISWTWLEMLQGLHVESSYQGDFSWIFSKLNTLIRYSNPKELKLIIGLGAFYYAIGRDHAGATYLMNELIKRDHVSPHFNTWFWGGYHGYYNLGNRQLASNLFEHAARFDSAPPYVAALAARLKFGDELMNSAERNDLLQRSLDPDLFEKVKKARPTWFESK